MASFRRRVEASTGKVFYQATWSLYDVKGNRHRKTKAFDRQVDAKAHAAKMEIEHERRGIDPTKLTFDDFKDRMIAHWQSKPNLQITTTEQYVKKLDYLSREIGNIRLDKLTPWHIDKAFANLRKSGGVSRRRPEQGKEPERKPLSEQSLLHIHRVGSAAMKQAVRWKMLAENPFNHVDAPSPDAKPIGIMTEDEGKRVYAAAVKAATSGKWVGYDLLVAIAMTCGLRRSEILGLTFDAINMQTGDITIARTVITGGGNPILREQKAKTKGSLRTMRIPADLLPMVKRHKATISQMALEWGAGYEREPLLLFPDFGGKPLLPGKLTTRLRQFQRQAKVTGVMPSHGFRHTMASELVAKNLDIRAVANRLGHSTVAFTLSRYVHPVAGRDQLAADTMGEQFRAITGTPDTE